jgi:hypothetical protein
MWLEVALLEYVFTLVNWEIRVIRWMPHELNDESQKIECQYSFAEYELKFVLFRPENSWEPV